MVTLQLEIAISNIIISLTSVNTQVKQQVMIRYTCW